MSLEGLIKDHIDELTYETIKTIRGNKYNLQLLKCKYR